MTQISFADEAYTSKKKTTRKERFLSEMNAVLPWKHLLQPIEEVSETRQRPLPDRGRDHAAHLFPAAMVWLE